MARPQFPNKHYTVIIADRAQKNLGKLPQKVASKVVFKLDLLSGDLFQGTKLAGELSGLFSLRVWPYRIIYRVDDKKKRVEVVDIGHRQGIY